MEESKGFKETEIGLIPEDWEVVRLGEVVKIIRGKKPKTLSESPTKNSLPYLTADYFRNRIPNQFVEIEIEKNLQTCKKDDVILIWDGSKAGQVFTGLEGILASTMVKINPAIDKFDKAYLYYFLTTKFNYLNSQTTGSTIPHVNKTVFLNLLIPLPPLDEQQKIANILTTIDQKIQAEEKKKQALQNLFKTLLQQLMTGKIRVRHPS
jgi:type I restriction enzyme S subunit